MNIVFLDTRTIGDVPNLKNLEQFGEVVYYSTTSPDQTLERVKEAKIIITNKVILDKTVIEAADELKLICVAATGTDNVDLEAAEARGIPVKNVKGYASESVAQGTFSLLLHFLQNIPYYDDYVKSGQYSQSGIFTNVERTFWEISGKRFGIIGLGNIGQQVAGIAEAFGAEVVYYSTSGNNTRQPYLRLELKELLRSSDIVTVHAPLNEYTADLIDYEHLTLMKRSALLINTGRGGIVNENDLARAIDDGLIAGAGVDVFEREPIDSNHPFLHLKNKDRLILTPHVTWSSIEARTLLVERIGQNIRDYFKKS